MYTHTYIYAHTHTPSLSLSLTHTHLYTCTHTHAYTNSYKHTQTHKDDEDGINSSTLTTKRRNQALEMRKTVITSSVDGSIRYSPWEFDLRPSRTTGAVWYSNRRTPYCSIFLSYLLLYSFLFIFIFIIFLFLFYHFVLFLFLHSGIIYRVCHHRFNLLISKNFLCSVA